MTPLYHKCAGAPSPQHRSGTLPSTWHYYSGPTFSRAKSLQNIFLPPGFLSGHFIKMTWFLKEFLSPPPVSLRCPWRVAHPERPSLKASGQLCFKEGRSSLKHSWPLPFKEGRSGWATVQRHGKETYESDRNFQKFRGILRGFQKRIGLSFPSPTSLTRPSLTT